MEYGGGGPAPGHLYPSTQHSLSHPDMLRFFHSHHLAVFLGPGLGHFPPCLGSSCLRDLSGSHLDSGAESMFEMVRGRCSGGLGSPPWPLLGPWDPPAESCQASWGGGWVRGAATGVSSESDTAGFHPSLWGPVPSLIWKMYMTILSHMVPVTCRSGAGQCLAQSWPLRGLPALPLTCCPPSHLCFGSQAQERPASVLSAPSTPLPWQICLLS